MLCSIRHTSYLTLIVNIPYICEPLTPLLPYCSFNHAAQQLLRYVTPTLVPLLSTTWTPPFSLLCTPCWNNNELRKSWGK